MPQADELGTLSSELVSGTKVPGDWGAPDEITKADDFVGTWPGGEPLTANTHTIIQRDGDYIFVRDNLKDGKSAATRVSIAYCIRNGAVDKSLAGNSRTCRNPHGMGTWGKCNFDWPENCVYNVRVGTYDAETKNLKLDLNTSLLGFED